MAEKIALPLVWVQLHWETVAFLGVAETVIDDGQGALPVFEKVFCALHPGRVRITFVFAQPEALTYVAVAAVRAPAVKVLGVRVKEDGTSIEVQLERVTQPASDCSDSRTAYSAGATGFLSMPWDRPIDTGPSRPLEDVTTTEKTAPLLDWVQVHSLNTDLAVPEAGLAVVVIEVGQGAEPVLTNGFKAVQPGIVNTTFVLDQPESLV